MPIEVPFELAQVEIVWIESTLYFMKSAIWVCTLNSGTLFGFSYSAVEDSVASLTSAVDLVLINLSYE